MMIYGFRISFTFLEKIKFFLYRNILKKMKIKKRDKKYTEAFLKKWGKEMTQIFILRKDFKNILIDKGLNEILKKGKYGELIRKLLK